MLNWSREQFNSEAKDSVDIISSIALNDSSDSSSSWLSRWLVKADPAESNCRLYLLHAPVQRLVDLSDDRLGGANTIKDSADEADYVDESILQDYPDTIEEKTSKNKDTTTWFFSIVYSDTWKAPILYFNVDHNGSPCSRSTMVKLLMQYSHYNRVEDAWEFLSYEEHPITRIPSFFLHPCRTLERLETLTTANPDESPPCLLLTWMTLILPSVGYPIPSKIFQKMLASYKSIQKEKQNN